MTLTERFATWLCGLFVLDRVLKALAVWHFFRRPAPSPPARWPSVSLLQPLTRGVRDAEGTLRARLALHYPAGLEHFWIVDRDDAVMRTLAERLCAEHPELAITLVVVPPDLGVIATKTAKLCQALPLAQGEVLWFLDDDVTLPTDGLLRGVPWLLGPEIGSVFGLARYTNWGTGASSAMSAFVNNNALLSYIPLIFLTEPFTITGHCYALHRAVWNAIEGDEALVGRIDDDHELARRVRRHGLRNVQMPLVYGVDNALPDAHGYLMQLQRWFVIPKKLMLPHLGTRERAAMGVGSGANWIPSLLLPLALTSRSAWVGRLLVGTLVLTLGLYGWLERMYTGGQTPLARLPFVLVGTVVDPLLILFHLLAGDTIRWRGQRLRVYADGSVEVV